MPKNFYALEKRIREGYRETSLEIRQAILKMSSDEIAAGKLDILALSNIMALPEEVDVKDFDAPQLYTVDEDGTANIKVVGILSTQVDWCAAYFQEATTTYGFIRAAATEADNDPAVKKIRFNVDTPGGIVTDLDITSQVIAKLKKPTETVGYNMIASAGIWLFTQTDKIIAADPSVFFGSIGVAVSYVDRTESNKKDGVKVVELTNDDSPDKRPDLSTDEGKQVLIKELNDLYNIFVRRVASGRNTTAEDVKENYGKGTVLIAEDAMRVGMIDDVMLKTGTVRSNRSNKTGLTNPGEPEKRARAQNKPKQEVNMTLDELLAANPEAKNEYDKRLAEAKKTAKAEGVDEVRVDAKKLAPYLQSDEYDSAIKETAVDALNGDITIDSFLTIVKIEDRRKEKAKAEATEEETVPDTKSERQTQSDPDKPKTPDDMKELVANMKNKKGGN